jgi:hypothetical protein
MMRFHLSLFVGSISLAAVPARAETDTQAWLMGVVQGPVTGRLIAYAEVQPRFTDGPDRFGQLLLRPAVGIQLGPRTAMLFGYAFVRTEPRAGRATSEHRAWQQISWPIARVGTLDISARTRIEQRSIVGADDLGWRFRQQVRASRPLSRGGQTRAVIWTEPFYNLDTTSWGQRAGFDQWRTFIGVAVPVAPKLSIEPGYLNQTVFRRGEDRVNHAASLNLFYRF